MIRRIRRTKQARRDILRIHSYISQHNISAAEKVLDGIEKTIRSLAQFPNVGTMWVTSNPALEGMRFTPVSRYRNYLIFFRTVGRVVEVYRVVHGAQNLPDVIEATDR